MYPLLFYLNVLFPLKLYFSRCSFNITFPFILFSPFILCFLFFYISVNILFLFILFLLILCFPFYCYSSYYVSVNIMFRFILCFLSYFFRCYYVSHNIMLPFILYFHWYLLLYLPLHNVTLPISLVDRDFANSPEDHSSNPTKDIKMVLDTSLLKTQYYKERIKGNVKQSR